MTNLFITLTDTTSGHQLRIQTSQIAGYKKEVLHSTQEVVTAVYITHPEISVIFVRQTPEELDKILSDCYITVRHEV